MSAPTHLPPSIRAPNWKTMEGPVLGPVFPRNVPRPQRPPTVLPGTNVERPMHYRWRKVFVESMSEIWVQEDALVAGEWNTGTNGKQWYYHRGDANTDPAAWYPLPPWSWPELVRYFPPGEWHGRHPI